MKTLNKLKAITFLSLIIFVSCTKVNRNDDFTKGDPPPVPGGYTNSNQVASNNLVAYWSFDGDLKDAVSGAVGTNKGMTFSEGLKGKALKGSDNAADKAHAFTSASAAVAAMTEYTISCWVNTSQNLGATGIVSFGNTQDFWGNVNIFLENGGTSTKARFKTIFQNGNFQSDNGIQDVENGFNNWTNYSISYTNTGKFSSFVNGTLVDSKTVPTTNIHFNNLGPIVFGALHFMTTPSSTTASAGEPWAGYIQGKIDEVRIFNKALSTKEISALSILEGQGR